jgi:hypothetical protein
MGYARHQLKGMFSQKHYAFMAARLNEVYMKYKKAEMEWAMEPLDEFVRLLVSYFNNDNPNFKPGIFFEAAWKGTRDEEK